MSAPTALPQLLEIYKSFAATPTKPGAGPVPKEVGVFVRVQKKNGADGTPSISIEKKHIFQRILIGITGKSHQYKFEENVRHLGNLIQQGFKELGEGKGTEEDLQKVAACFGYYQDLVQYYASKHCAKEVQNQEEPQRTAPEEAKNAFVDKHLHFPLWEFEQKLKIWKNAKETGADLYATYALHFVEDAKKKALETSGTTRVSILITLFTFMKEATQLKEFDNLALAPRIRYLGTQIPKGSPLREEFNVIVAEWEKLQTPGIDLPIDASSLKKYLDDICGVLSSRLDALALSVSAEKSRAPEEAVEQPEKNPVEVKDLTESHGIETDRGPESPLPGGREALIAEDEKVKAQKLEISSQIQALDAALSSPSGNKGFSLGFYMELAALKENLKKARTTGDLQNVNAELARIQLVQRAKETESEEAEEEATGKPREPEPLQIGEEVKPEFSSGAEIGKRLLKKDELQRRIAALKASLPANSALRSELDTLELEFGRAPPSSDLSLIFGRLTIIESTAQEKPVDAPEEQERPRAIHRTKVSPQAGECEAVRMRVTELITYLEKYKQDLGVADIVDFAKKQLQLKRPPKSEHEELEGLFDSLFTISYIVDFTSTQEKSTQLRLWTLRALSVALTSPKLEKQFFVDVADFSDRAKAALYAIQRETRVDISQTLAAIDSSIPVAYREKALAFIGVKQTYDETLVTQAILENPVSVIFSHPTDWEAVHSEFNRLRNSIEDPISQLRSKIIDLTRIEKNTLLRVETLKRSLNALKKDYEFVRGFQEAQDLVTTLTEPPQSVDQFDSWQTRVGYLEKFVDHLTSILSLKSPQNEDWRQLTNWALFGITSARSQFLNRDYDHTEFAKDLEKFCAKAALRIQQTGERIDQLQRLVADVTGQCEDLNQILRARGEAALSLPEERELYQPDFFTPTSTPLSNPLDWEAIETAWEKSVSTQFDVYKGLESEILFRKLDSEERSKTVCSLQRVSQELKAHKLDAPIQRLIPTAEDLKSAPLDRLDNLLAVLNGIDLCENVLSSEKSDEPASEYQLQIARFTMNALRTYVQDMSAHTLLIPQPTAAIAWRKRVQKGEPEIFEGTLEEKSSTQLEDPLARLVDLMSVEEKLNRVSETSKRNLGEEFRSLSSSIERLKKSSSDLVADVLDTAFSISDQEEKTGSQLLSDIEAIVTLSPNSKEDPLKYRETAAIALSTLKAAFLVAECGQTLGQLSLAFAEAALSGPEDAHEDITKGQKIINDLIAKRSASQESIEISIQDYQEIEKTLTYAIVFLRWYALSPEIATAAEDLQKELRALPGIEPTQIEPEEVGEN